jgi:hypothetical protein
MPQLDLMSFFSQFFWFSIGFSTFYIFLLHYIIPSIVLTLKFRKKKLELLATDINKKKEGASDLLNTYDSIISKALNFSRILINKINDHGNSWVTSTVIKVNASSFQESNKSYVKAIGEKDFGIVLLDAGLKNNTKDSYWSKLWKK